MGSTPCCNRYEYNFVFFIGPIRAHGGKGGRKGGKDEKEITQKTEEKHAPRDTRDVCEDAARPIRPGLGILISRRCQTAVTAVED